MRHRPNTLTAVIDAAGSQAALAAVIGKPQQTVSYWLKHGKPLPAEYVFKVEKALGIPRHVSRPDLFARPEAAE